MKILHRLFAVLLVGFLLVGCLPTVSAATSGKSGDLTWNFKNGVLTFSGKGSSEDLDAHSVGDWNVHADKIRTVVFAEGVTRIGAYLFYDDTIYNTIKTIRLPATLTEIGEHAFTTLKGLEQVNITDLAAWCGVKMKNGSNPLDNQADLHLGGKKVIHLEIPQAVTVISDYAFKGCRSIKKVTVHSGVKRIGSFAFNTCANLKEMYFEGSAPSMGQSIMVLTKATVYTPAGDTSWNDTAKARLDKKKTLSWETYSPKTTPKTTKATTAKTTEKTTKTTGKPTDKTTVTTAEKTTVITETKVTTAKTEKVTVSTTKPTSATETVPTVMGDSAQTSSPPNNGWWLWALGGVIVAALLGFLLAKRLTKR